MKRILSFYRHRVVTCVCKNFNSASKASSAICEQNSRAFMSQMTK